MLLNDGVRNHPKVWKAGPEAAWLWAAAIDFSREQTTDGLVPEEILPGLGPFRNPKASADRLVAVGLFERVEGGYLVHDFLAHNASAEEVRAKRKMAAERKNAWKARHRNGDGTPVERGGNALPVRSDHVPLTRARVPAPGRGDVDGDVRTDPRTDQQPGEGSGEGVRPRLHTATKGIAFPGVVNLPAFLLHEFMRKSGKAHQDEQYAYVAEWFGRVNDEWQAKVDAGAVIGDDDVTFWRARWAETHGTTRQRTRDADVKRKQAEFGAYTERLRRQAEGGAK